MKTKWCLLVLALLVLPAVAADAQNPDRRPAAGGANRPALGQAGGPNGVTAFERVLTDEQRQKLRESMQAQGADVRGSMQELAQLRRELNEAVFGGQADAKFIQEKTDAIAKLEAEQMRVRMTALSKIAATFTPEQKEKIKEIAGQMRAARPALGAGPGLRDGDAPVRRGEPAAPPPPEK